MIGDRRVRFNTLRVKIEDASCFIGKGCFNYGETKKRLSGLWDPEITIYLRHHTSETQLIGTVLHEVGHAITLESETDDHPDTWYENTAHLMAVVKNVTLNVDLNDISKFEFCARQWNVNLIEN